MATCLILLSGLTAFLLGAPQRAAVPKAIVESQGDLVSGVARSLNRSTNRALDDLKALASAKPAPAALIEAAKGTWQGIAVLNPTAATPVAADGSAVPAERIVAGQKAGTVPYADASGALNVLAYLALPDGNYVAATRALSLRSLHLDPESQQSVQLILPDGTPAGAQGIAPAATPWYQEMVMAVASSARAGAHSSSSDADANGVVTLVSGSEVGDSRAVVISVTHPAQSTFQSGLAGRLWAAALAVIAALVVWLAWATLARPVARLTSRAKAAACDVPYPASPRPRLAETRRIWDALDQLTGSPAQSRQGGLALSAITGTIAAAVIIVIWSTSVIVLFGLGSATLPSQIAADVYNSTEDVADSIRDTLDHGLAQAQSAAASPDSKVLGEQLAALADSSRYRSAYALNASGQAVSRHGDSPSRRGMPASEQGVQLDSANGRVPAIFAYARRADGGFVIVEFDVRYLTSILERLDGETRVVDAGLHTILDTSGYRAFEPLTGEALRNKATEASGGSAAGVVNVGGVPSLTTATATTLDWVVVAQQPLRSLDLPSNRQRDVAWLVGVLGVTIAVLLAGWNYFVLIRPLRRLAAEAEEAATGKRKTPITLRRHDEIGAIAVCAEICHQTGRTLPKDR